MKIVKLEEACELCGVNKEVIIYNLSSTLVHRSGLVQLYMSLLGI